MAERHPHFTATVIHRQIAGEKHLRLQLICPEEGLVSVLCRNTARNSNLSLPDLFDDGDFLTSLSSSGSLFLNEFQLQRRRSSLARHYQVFRYACELATIYGKNLEHVEEPAPAIRIFHRALDAFETALCPEVTFFKSLYLFARVEGFPVKEGWWQSLPAELRQDALAILSRELKEQTHPSETTDLLTRRLSEWLSVHAGFVFPKAQT